MFFNKSNFILYFFVIMFLGNIVSIFAFNDNFNLKRSKSCSDIGIVDNYSIKEDKKNNKITFEQWRNKCMSLPTPDKVEDGDYKNTALNLKEFFDEIVICVNIMGSEVGGLSVDNKKLLINGALNNKKIKKNNIEKTGDVKAKDLDEKFFVQKLDVEKATPYIHADVHGDIHSLILFLDSLYNPKSTKTDIEKFFDQETDYKVKFCNYVYNNSTIDDNVDYEQDCSQEKLKKPVFDDNFKIIDPNDYIVLLGDYTGRGIYCAEVLYTIARLKIANPKNVILLRGNHDCIGMGILDGLFGEFYEKFGKFINEEEVFRLFNDFYNFLPVALFMGVLPNDECDDKNYILFCHGGIEFGYNPNPLLLDKRRYLFECVDKLDISWLKGVTKFNLISSGFKCKKNENISTQDLSFLWGDFCFEKSGVQVERKDGLVICRNKIGHAGVSQRGFIFSDKLTKNYIDSCSSKENKYFVRYIIRGHQHNGDVLNKMIQNAGYHNLWNSCENKFGEKFEKFDETFPVWTLNACPGFSYSYNVKKEEKDFCNSDICDDDCDLSDRYEKCLESLELPKYSYDTYAKLNIGREFENWGLEIHSVNVFDL
ncbi:MAG: hypothetical protein UR12_C0012G0002 [candidate division TM6 bacterium GW2011_GWF2_30_66]|nr:MAG: hypothetical protein UR12_C0012G0002 [candidate division TM6 bacterium GW2011_GWF2_30_66]